MTELLKGIHMSIMSMKTTISYGTSFWAGILFNFIQIFIFYYIWMAVYGSKMNLHGISKKQILTYVILSRLLFSLMTYGVNLMMASKIGKGDISVELLRPIDFQLSLYMMRIGDFIISLFINALPVILIGTIFLDFKIPNSPVNFILFFVSFFFSMTISFLIEFITGLMSFYTTNGWGLQVLKEAIIALFSGALVPINFFPEILKNIVNFLPFKDMVYTPVAIYLGITENGNIYYSFLFQLFWTLILFIISRLFYIKAIKKVTVQGG